MSGVDDRIVSIEFDNSKFERRIESTIASLDKLTETIKFAEAQRGISNIADAANRFDISSMANGIDNISSKFSTLGAVGLSAIQNITGSIIDFVKNTTGDVLGPIITGGRQRAQNIEQAKFMFRGLGIDVEAGMKSALDAVLGTSFGLDEAAKAAAQFGASGIQVGDQMTSALRGVAGAAAMTGKSFSEIADIFAGSAATGFVNNQDLMQFATRGLNAAAAVGKVMGKTEAQIHEMATNGELDFKTFAAAMDTAFGQNATKANETFAGSLANLHAAMSRMGAALLGPRLEQERDVFNALTPVIDNLTKAFKPLFDVINGFTRASADKFIGFLKGLNFDNFTTAMGNFAAGLKNIFAAVGQFAGLVKEAFRDIFPKSATSTLVTLSELFLKFTEQLKMGGKTAEEVKNIFRGIFAAFSIGFEVVKGIAGLFATLFSALADAAGIGNGGILAFFSKLGQSLVDLKKSLVDGNGIKDFFAGLRDIILHPLDAIEKFKVALAGLFGDGKIPGAEAATNVLDRVKDRLDVLSRVAEAFKKIWEAVSPVLDKLWTFIKNWFSELGHKLADAFKPGDFNAALDILNVGLIGGIIVLLKKFSSGDFLGKIGGGFLDKLKGLFDGLTGSLKAMQAQLQSKTLLNIAIAVGVLTASMVLLSLIDSAALTKALGAMTVGFGELAGMMLLLDKIASSAGKLAILGAALILLSSAMLILSVAIKLLSTMNWNELATGLAGVAGGLGLLIVAVNLMPESPKLILTGIALIAISTSLVILSAAVKLFSTLSWEEMAKGLTGVAGGLLIIAGAMQLMPANLILTAPGLIAVALSLVILAGAVKLFSTMSWEDMAKGLVGVAAGLLIIAAAMNLMPPNLPITALGLIGVSIALNIMAEAIKIMGKMNLEEMVKGLGSLAIMLGIVAVATIAMSGALPGAAALLVVSAALSILADVLKKLGQLSIGQLVTSLLALVGVFVVIGAASFLLEPLIPAILGLAVALGVMGAAIALFGVGAFLLAKAFETLAESGKAGIQSLQEVIQIFITALPQFAIALVESLVGASQKLLEAMPLLIRLIEAFLSQMLETIINLAPKFGDAFIVLITEGLRVIREKFPDILQTGIDLLLELLTGIRDNISQVTQLAIDIVINFATTLTDNAQRLVDAAFTLLTTFLQSIANRIGDVITAGYNILIAFIQGIGDNLVRVVNVAGDVVVNFITAIGNKAGDIATAGANALVNFLDGIGNDIWKVSNKATDVAIEFINAIGDNAVRFANAAADALVNFLNGLADAIRNHADDLRNAGINIAGAIIDGMTFGLADKAQEVADKAVDVAGDAVDAVTGFLGINSPSKKFISIGKSMAEGLVNALDNDNTAKNSAVRHAEEIVKAFEKSLLEVSDSLSGLGEFDPVITPVIDLTNIEKASRDLDQLLATPIITPDFSISQANLISKTSDLDSNTPDIQQPSTPSEVKFEQNIFAPHALSTNDIYRNTKSQIVLAKEDLNIP